MENLQIIPIICLVALSPSWVATELNLFKVDVSKKSGLTRTAAAESGSKKTNCERSILEEFRKLNGTGAKVHKLLHRFMRSFL